MPQIELKEFVYTVGYLTTAIPLGFGTGYSIVQRHTQVAPLAGVVITGVGVGVICRHKWALQPRHIEC